jgi:serine/threonine protein kinase
MTEIARSSIGRLEQIARGGQGRIYRAPQVHLPSVHSPLVFKEYKPQLALAHGPAIRHALGTMVAIRARADEAVRIRIDARSMWPLAVVVEREIGVGLIMRELSDEFFTTIRYSTGTVERVVREIQLYTQSKARIKARGLSPLDAENRLYLLFKIASHLSFLHDSLNIVVGDISGKNIAFSPGAGGPRGMRAVFIDTDSFRNGDSVPPMAQPNTPDWEAPEVLDFSQRARAMVQTESNKYEIARLRSRARVQHKESDAYKFGLLTLRLFHQGEDASLVRVSDSAAAQLLKHLGPRRASVLMRTLDPLPQNRPSMATVAEAIRG